MIQVSEGLPYHEWLIDFEVKPEDMPGFCLHLDEEIRRRNIYYDDLIKGGVLQPLKVTLLEDNAFRKFMDAQGKLGGQNKIPRLSNDRSIAEVLGQWRIG